MHQNRAFKVLPVKILIHVTEDHHREFQALGAVDAHDAHAAGILLRCDLGFLAPRHEAAEIIRQLKDRDFSHGGHVLSIAAQIQQTAAAQFSVLHGAEYAQKMQLVIDLPQKLIGRKLRRQFT